MAALPDPVVHDVEDGRRLWAPSAERAAAANITRFAAHVGIEGSYRELWQWSVDDLEGFWAAVWDFFGVEGSYERVLGSRAMPGAEWFPGAQLNYAEHVFRGRDDDALALQFASETRPLTAWSWADLRRETARIRAGLVTAGVGRGDRVAAYLPNVPEAMAACLATISLGAIWSSAAPEFGARSVVDRFAQIEPKLLLAVDGYRYGDRAVDRREVREELAAAIGARLVRLDLLAGTGWEPGFLGPEDSELAFERVPFAHPQWILYSSGTTGLPKPIVHSQGGMLLEQLKHHHLHLDAQAGDRIFWMSTTGWMMWNCLLGVLLTPATPVLYDGSPAGDVLWDLAADAGVTTFGTSASYVSACMKDGVRPTEGRDLSRLTALGSTGSPLTPEGFDWLYEHLGPDLWLQSTSGGTDVCSSFVCGVPTLPVDAGEIQARALGADVRAYDPEGRSVIGEVGELVLQQPLPSMPVAFWGDADGTRMHEAYFDMYPGVWRHGDWVEITGRDTVIITGRSDATINRNGIRIGTSEIYRAVLASDEVVDALIVDIPRDGRPNWMPLFVVLREGATLDDGLRGRIRVAIGEQCTLGHLPSEIHQIAKVPRTLSGKAVEVPIKRILMGDDPAAVISREALADPAALDAFVAQAAALNAGAAHKPGARTPTEAVLHDIWARLLPVDELGIHDDFFAHGGYSLLALQMLAEVEEALGVAVPVEGFIERPPTVAALAAFVDAGGAAGVPDRDGPVEGEVLWFAHPTPGGAITMRHFTPANGLDIPAIGLTPPRDEHGLLDSGMSRTDLSDLMLEELLRRQPQGPYRIAGYSLGGTFAYDIAGRLVERGETVAFLGIFDVATPAAIAHRARRSAKLLRAVKAGPSEALRRVRRRRELYAEAGQSSAELREAQDRQRLIDLAAEPLDRVIDGPLTVWVTQPTLDQFGGPAIGWDAHHRGPVTALPLPGDHETANDAEHIGTLVGSLGEQLARTEARSLAA